MQILTDRQIRQKIRRLAIQILERNFGEPEIVLAGLNNNGFGFAQMMLAELEPICPPTTKITLTRLRLSPANPLADPISIDLPDEELAGRVVIVVDDVANSGRTLFFAMKPLLEVLPKKVEVAVLVDRTHKSFPIKCDYVGLSLATTLLEDVDCQIRGNEELAVFLN